jgi:hypothetical protein
MKRCEHFMPPFKCVVQGCQHWDGFKNDGAAVSATNRDRLVRAKLRAREQLAPGMARCVRCKEIKSIEDDFYACSNSPKSHHTTCKVCKARLALAAGGDLMDVSARSA